MASVPKQPSLSLNFKLDSDDDSEISPRELVYHMDLAAF